MCWCAGAAGVRAPGVGALQPPGLLPLLPRLLLVLAIGLVYRSEWLIDGRIGSELGFCACVLCVATVPQFPASSSSDPFFCSSLAQPQWVIYHQLVLTSREYIREVLAIEPQVLFASLPLPLCVSAYCVPPGSLALSRLRAWLLSYELSGATLLSVCSLLACAYRPLACLLRCPPFRQLSLVV